MCGIAGIVGNSNNIDALSKVNAMLWAQHHRGPDATDTWSDAYACLGHNRLSIIDLSEGANQPMLDFSGNLVIVFNGEIYNYLELKKLVPDYPFKTKSDTEVVLALFLKYGKEMLPLLNGMFAMSIWDQSLQQLFIARDRFGVKPFYYSFQNGRFHFASEIKSLWQSGITRERNEGIWAKYFVFGSYGLPHETFWENIHALPAGHYAELKVHQITHFSPVKWYDFVERVHATPQYTLGELKESYLNLMQDSIRLRFRSDVPVGFNISGGLDSSALLSLVNEQHPNHASIEAFTFYCNDDRYDELPWVEKMISKTGNPLNEVLMRPDMVPDLVAEVSKYQDEPFGGFPTLAYSLLFKEARKKGIIVLLDGQGMDEAWAGYDYYFNNSGNTIQGTLLSPYRPEVLTEDFRKLAIKEIYDRPFDDPLQNLQYRDLFYTKIPRALRFNDRISMMHSTELREPFLDYRMVELAFAQPKSIKYREGQVKWLLRDMVSQSLGNDLAFAPKRPLQTPQREWIREELKQFTVDSVEQFKNYSFVNKNILEKSLQDYFKTSQDNSFSIWQWINTALLK